MSIQNAELTKADILGRTIERKKGEHYFDYYANDAQLVTSYYDFQLSFGEMLEASKDKLITEDALTVKMSPQLAKRIRDIFVEQVEAYEGKHGIIPIPNGAAKDGDKDE